MSALPQADYKWNIQSFSLSKLEYKSNVFRAGGYNWSLSLYPNNGSGYISLYLSIVDTYNFGYGWKVDVRYKLSVYDKIWNKYFTIQGVDGPVSSFNSRNTRWGCPRFLSLEKFRKPSNGYLKDGSCTFRAEVSIVNSMVKNPPNNSYIWIIPNLFMSQERIFSLVGRSWKLKVDSRSVAAQNVQAHPPNWNGFPRPAVAQKVQGRPLKWNGFPRPVAAQNWNGYPRPAAAQKGTLLSVGLEAQDLPPIKRVYVEFELRVLDRYNITRINQKASGRLSALCPGKKAVENKRWAYQGTVTVEVKILAIST